MPKVDNTNIRKRAENSFQIRIAYQGKVHYREFQGSLAEARIFRDKLRLEIASGLITSYEKITFEQFLTEVFDKNKLQFHEPNYRKSVWGHFRNYLQPLANLQMNKITALDIDNLFTDIRTNKSHLSETTLEGVYTTLNTMFNHAEMKQLVAKNPMKFVTRPKGRKFRKVNMWSVKEQLHFLEVAKEVQPQYYPVYVLGFYMGRRRSELLAITWDNINFDKKLITLEKKIQTTVTPYPSIKYYGKNSHTLKTLSVVDEVLDILKQIQATKMTQAISNKTPLPKPTDLVFTDENGKLLHLDTVTRNFKKLATELNLPLPFTFHSTRHKLITDLNRAGHNARDIANYVGHSTTQMALDVYYHPNEESIESTANKISEMYNDR